MDNMILTIINISIGRLIEIVREQTTEIVLLQTSLNNMTNENQSLLLQIQEYKEILKKPPVPPRLSQEANRKIKQNPIEYKN
jgi:hypothetical protein